MFKRVSLAVMSSALFSCAPEVPVESGPVEWTVGPEITSIGEMDGDSVYLFQRIGPVVLTPGDEVAVMDNRSDVVRIFGTDGTFRRQFGRSGEGPGEFGSVRRMWLESDTVLAFWDSELYRISSFDLRNGTAIGSGNVDRSQEAMGVGRLDYLAGVLDGSVVIASMAFGPDGIDQVSLEHFGLDGSHLGRKGFVDGLHRKEYGSGSTSPAPFSPFPRSASASGRVFHTRGYGAELRWWTESDSGSIPIPAVAHDPIAAFGELREAVEVAGSDWGREIMEEESPPDSIPHVGGLLADESGLLWVKEFEPTEDGPLTLWQMSRGGTWNVIQPDGRHVASVAVPRGILPRHISDTLLVGVSRDDLGVERVKIFPLDRNPAGEQRSN